MQPKKNRQNYSIGVDVGGTFTDLVLSNELTGETLTEKILTTPDNPSEGILNGIDKLLWVRKIGYDQISQIVHGTTIGSNTVIERTGSRVGFISSEGFSDILHMGREWRYDIYDLGIRFNPPLTSRKHCVEVVERTLHDGSVYKPLDSSDLTSALKILVDQERVESIALTFLHSYANPTNERKARDLIHKLYPNMFVSISSDIMPTMREYERASATVANSYVGPIVSKYLDQLKAQLGRRGFKGQIFLITSAGALMTISLAKRFPVRLLESGPAAGVIVAQFIGNAISRRNLLSFDMGGTTSKGSLIVHGLPHKSEELEVARIHRYKPGSGIPLRIPSIGMVEIGVGGGSVARLDERGVVSVGPRSAGASPGPMCYGLGGSEPTVTDADLVLGYLDPQFFLGGRMKLDLMTAKKGLSDALARPLGVSIDESAYAVHIASNEMIASSFRLHAAERGIDYTKASVMAFGGAGPIHAIGVARNLGIKNVIFPLHAGVLSAYGLLVSRLAFDVTKTRINRVSDLDWKIYVQTFRKLIEDTETLMRKASIADFAGVERSLDMRYVGQGYEVEVKLGRGIPNREEYYKLPRLFKQKYMQMYTEALVGTPEIVNYKITVLADRRKVKVGFKSREEKRQLTKQTGTKKAYFESGYQNCTVWNRYALRPGDRISGPAIINEFETTALLDRNTVGEIDGMFNLVTRLNKTG